MPARDFLNTSTLLLTAVREPELSLSLEPRFDRLTRVAREALRVAAAGIAVSREGSFWFKSIAGWDIDELPGKRSLCQLAIDKKDLVVVPDLLEDRALREHPLAKKAPHIRFYAGYPLRDAEGRYVATLCAYDTRPRTLSRTQMQVLRDLGAMAQRELMNDAARDVQRQLVSKLGAARRDAMIDALTRVWNRRAGLQLLEEACTDVRDDSAIAVAMLDLDRFKAINDSHGHQTGDEILRKVARLMVSAVRDGDVVSRYGGDEFMLIFRGLAADEVERLLERIRQRVSESPIRTRAGDMEVSVTAGSAIVEPGRLREADSLIRQADQALLRKKQGRTADSDAGSEKKSAAKSRARKRAESREERTYHRLQPLKEPAPSAGEAKDAGQDPYDASLRKEFAWD